MAKKEVKNEEIMCGCGRPDLYEEMLKIQKKEADKKAESNSPDIEKNKKTQPKD